MSLRTPFTELFAIEIPVLQVAIWRATSAELIATVGEAGAIFTTSDALLAQAARVRELTDRPFVVNHVVPSLDEDAFAATLTAGPAAVSFALGSGGQGMARPESARWRSYRRSPMRSGPLPCSPQAAWPTAAAWPPRWRSAGLEPTSARAFSFRAQSTARRLRGRCRAGSLPSGLALMSVTASARRHGRSTSWAHVGRARTSSARRARRAPAGRGAGARACRGGTGHGARPSCGGQTIACQLAW